MAESEHVLLTTFTTCLTLHVQPGGGGDEPLPHQPIEVVEYHIPPVFRDVWSFQQSHSWSKGSHVRLKCALMFSAPTHLPQGAGLSQSPQEHQ